MKTLFFPISSRTAGHGVRCTLLALRLSALLPATNSNNRVFRQIDVEAVRWLDTHCHLNAIAHSWSRRHVHA